MGSSALAKWLRAPGATEVYIQFAGCGDSGTVDVPSITMANGSRPPLEMLERVRDWAGLNLEGTGVRWYSNEGGQRAIAFDLTTTLHTFEAYIDRNHLGQAWCEGDLV